MTAVTQGRKGPPRVPSNVNKLMSTGGGESWGLDVRTGQPSRGLAARAHEGREGRGGASGGVGFHADTRCTAPDGPRGAPFGARPAATVSEPPEPREPGTRGAALHVASAGPPPGGRPGHSEACGEHPGQRACRVPGDSCRFPLSLKFSENKVKKL